MTDPHDADRPGVELLALVGADDLTHTYLFVPPRPAHTLAALEDRWRGLWPALPGDLEARHQPLARRLGVDLAADFVTRLEQLARARDQLLRRAGGRRVPGRLPGARVIDRHPATQPDGRLLLRRLDDGRLAVAYDEGALTVLDYSLAEAVQRLLHDANVAGLRGLASHRHV